MSYKILNSKSALVSSVIGSLVFLLSGAPAMVQAATTTVSQTITAGSLTIGATSSVTLTSAAVATSNSTTTGTVTAITPSDTRGTGAGWTASVTSTNLGTDFSSGDTTLTNFTRTVTGSPSPGITAASGVYDGQNCVTAYSGTGAVNCGEVKIVVKTVSGSPAKPATVDLYKPSDLTTAETANATVSSNAVTFHGVTITFGSSTAYAVNDEYRLRVDAFPFGSLTNTPASLSGTGTPAASTTGVSLSAGSVFSGSNATSSAKTNSTATVNAGMGSYTYADALSWVIHSNPLVAGYTATLTYTIA